MDARLLPRLVRIAAGLLLFGLAVWGVLYAGRGLRAPPKLPERWTVAGPHACAGSDVSVLQSGVFVSVTWPGSVAPQLAGKLAGDRVLLSGETTGCGGGLARFEGTWTPARLTGELVAAGCPACPSRSVVAEPAP